MKVLLKVLFFCILLSSCSCINKLKTGNTVSGKVIKVIDGDTFDLLTLKDTIRVRIYGIDAPERGMPYYDVAKKYLNELSYGKNVAIRIEDVDSYKRIVATVYLGNGENLGLSMINAGLAWHYKYYSNDKEFSTAEKKARRLRKGLWADKDPIAPWKSRQLKKH